MNIVGKCDGTGSILWDVVAEVGQCEQPHRQIMKILAIAIWRLADSKSTRPAKHPVDLSHQIRGSIKVLLLMQVAVKRNQ
jgi:hypothetical protein